MGPRASFETLKKEKIIFPAGSGNPNAWLSSPQHSASLIRVGDFKSTLKMGVSGVRLLIRL